MRENIDVIKNSRLFAGIAEENIAAMLNCLSVRCEKFSKNDFIMRDGKHTDSLGMLLSGAALVIREDYMGNRNIIANVAPGEIFAESYVCAEGAPLGVSVTAAKPSSVMFLGARRVLSVCSSACEFHLRIVRNLLSVLAEKNLSFSDKLTNHASHRFGR